MCANAGPADYNYDETLNTLRYAERAKKIKNKPKINEDAKDALLRKFQEEITRLRQALELKKRNMTPEELAAYQANAAAHGGDGGEFDADVIERLQRESEEQRSTLLQHAMKVEQDKESAAKELEFRVAEMRENEQNQSELAMQLRALEERVIIGG